VAQLKLKMVRTSKLPDTFRQDDVTFHVPTTSPPQGVTLEQSEPVPPPGFEAPPPGFAAPPPGFGAPPPGFDVAPALPAGSTPFPELHAAKMNPNVSAELRTADLIFIEIFLPRKLALATREGGCWAPASRFSVHRQWKLDAQSV
jgi:hypothetical protein